MNVQARTHRRARPSAPRLLFAALIAATASTACQSADTRRDAAERATASIAPPPARDTFSALLNAPDQFMRRADTTIRYRDIGHGEPVVLLHGYSDRAEMWRKAADSLARNFRVIVPDIRGFGLSTRFREARYYGQPMIDDVLALLDSLHIPSAHVVGYSLGGLLTAQLSTQAPERIRSATLVAAAVFPDSASLATLLKPHIAALETGKGLTTFMKWILPTWPDTLLRDVSAQIYAANDSAVLVESLRAMPGLSLDWGAIGRTKVPAMVIVGRLDPLLPYSRNIARRWPGAVLRELDGNDHAVIADAPELVVEFRKLVSGGIGPGGV